MPISSFIDFMEARVLPHRKQHPDFVRLDGARSGGNREAFGSFRYRGSTRKVHSDTYFQPLLIAYEALRSDEVNEAFRVDTTRKGRSLVLVPELRKRQKSRFKHLYIYEI